MRRGLLPRTSGGSGGRTDHRRAGGGGRGGRDDLPAPDAGAVPAHHPRDLRAQHPGGRRHDGARRPRPGAAGARGPAEHAERGGDRALRGAGAAGRRAGDGSGAAGHAHRVPAGGGGRARRRLYRAVRRAGRAVPVPASAVRRRDRPVRRGGPHGRGDPRRLLRGIARGARRDAGGARVPVPRGAAASRIPRIPASCGWTRGRARRGSASSCGTARRTLCSSTPPSPASC